MNITPHPVVPILFWVMLTVAMQSLHMTGLMLAGLPLLLLAYTVASARLLTLLRRTRWIMLSLLLIYAYATPGEGVWVQLAEFSPTWEGLRDGLLQLSRLACALAGLSILLRVLSQQQLISGLYTLGYPLRYVGLSRERMAVRLALTMHYAESTMLDAAANWRNGIEQMFAAEGSPHGGGEHASAPPAGASAEMKQHCIELHASPFTLYDALLLVACVSLLLVLL
jgi:energy-coupling factor transporter transmembrane protein EcfT